MTPNILICQSERELEAHFANDFIAHIDGKHTQTLRQFYEDIADLLEIPNFGFTLEALNDSLNDLQWLEDDRIILYFTNTNELVGKERDPAKMGSILSVLDATAEDWKWVDEEEEIDKKEIILVFEDSTRIRKLLENETIEYSLLSALK
ncbi:barstar family protein [Spirosoma sp. KCTC 42546]|uniref:barstar family protein n=1 Tax=Spirosoma sp. KCTC 42546 TaxID=2520506 RepID=UPI001158B854|nr:barstar family protein [Spirosoma sp. KCTC 42546]QDK83486.1 barstar family protein [Spirosoma sp. KCTC 42546]